METFEKKKKMVYYFLGNFTVYFWKKIRMHLTLGDFELLLVYLCLYNGVLILLNNLQLHIYLPYCIRNCKIFRLGLNLDFSIGFSNNCIAKIIIWNLISRSFGSSSLVYSIKEKSKALCGKISFRLSTLD